MLCTVHTTEHVRVETDEVCVCTPPDGFSLPHAAGRGGAEYNQLGILRNWNGDRHALELIANVIRIDGCIK